MVNAKAREASKLPGCPVRAFADPVYNAQGQMVAGGEVGFGWEGATVDRAIHADNVAALQWAIDHGLVDKSTKTFFNTSLRGLCIEKCEAVLAKSGYTA